MPGHTILVLSNPAARHLTVLDKLPQDTHIVVGESEEAFRNSVGEAEVILTGGTYRDLLAALWPKAGKVRWVHSMAAGLESLLFPALVESPVPLTNARGVFARSLGEFALAGILHFSKGLARMRANQAAGRWEQFDVEELHGKTLGIVGFGEIGRATARLARAFGMRVHALRRRPVADDLVDKFYDHASLDAMLAASDYLLISAPLTAETQGMIAKRQLSQLPKQAVLINLGRGPVVVEADLIQALQSGALRGAVLDVFDVEPLPEGHAFYQLDNVLLSPHCADHTPTWLEDAMNLFVDNYGRFASGQELLNVVDKRSGY